MLPRTFLLIAISALSCGLALAAPRALPEGEKPDDSRLGPLKTLNGYFPFDVPETLEQWKQRRGELRRQLLVAAGLWPMPERGPVEAVVHGPVEREGYTVYKVYFQSLPGLYVTGNLYIPTDRKGPFPAVLCPHGHWTDGRFHAYTDEELKTELESGAEKFKIGGRNPLQARCVHLARMGCLVFHYDMLGYADSVPLSYELAHRFAEQRPKMSRPDHWGLFSAQSELRLINSFGLQTWNSLRAFDWLRSREDVDQSRIAVTGASGGGTQTFFLAALEPRIAAAFPAVMVSTAMQGGCTCENASYLRIGTGNIEIAGMIAPRPLGMSAANDWTRELETKGLPELKTLYAMYGAANKVVGKHFDFPHNYNAVSRAMMYRFFKTHLDLPGPVTESPYDPLTVEEMSVWDEEHPKPPSDTAAELALMRTIAERNQEQFTALANGPLDRYRQIVGGALDVMIGRDCTSAGTVSFKKTSESAGTDWKQTVGLLRNDTYDEELPTIVWTPTGEQTRTVIWPHVEGKAALVTDEGSPIEPVRRLLRKGFRVISADLLGQGEFTADGSGWEKWRKVDNPREFAGYTLGYNDPLISKRVHDLLSLIQYAVQSQPEEQSIALLGTDAAAAWCALAGAQSGPALDELVLVPNGFRFAEITQIRDVNLLPGAIKYGDLDGVLALCAPHSLCLVRSARNSVVRETYRKNDSDASLLVLKPGEDPLAQAIGWLTRGR